ncbi:MAG TPA: hypothetical protein VHC86_12825 [Opitutaceae bacterium]|nr:hypothetical protein [Opitutaceae bacterium]
MKTIPVLRPLLGVGLILPLAIAFASASPASAADAAPAATPKNWPACPYCHSVSIQETHATAAGGKLAPSVATVGLGHACDSCAGGPIAIVRGQESNQMTITCPICKQTEPRCCVKPTKS